jgi:LysM repeat protein
MKKLIYIGMIIGLVIVLNSCAIAPVKPPTHPAKEALPQPTVPLLRQDIFHTVAPGETLWHIGKMYDVKIESITLANNLKVSKELKMGQCLLIPQAAPIKPVVPLYRSNKWKYIIIHHSATDKGNALRFYRFHRFRGWKNLGYHFIIDNGSEGKIDGQIEVSPRWIKQQDGAHCKAGGMNYNGIGICLVGNFSKEDVSEKQMEALVYLVNMLRDYYNIPVKNILGHGEVNGAKTECPGKNFPWQEFYTKIKSKTDGR